MLNRFKQFFDGSTFKSWTETLQEQVWFQELKNHWEELDPPRKQKVRWITLGSLTGLSAFLLISWIWQVHQLKVKLHHNYSLLSFIQSAHQEIHDLKGRSPNPSTFSLNDGPETLLWEKPYEQNPEYKKYFEKLAQTCRFDSSALEIFDVKPGETTTYAKETLLKIKLKHLNIKQITQYTSRLEKDWTPIQLRNIFFETKSDLSGYLDATLAISVFSLIQAAPPTKEKPTK